MKLSTGLSILNSRNTLSATTKILREMERQKNAYIGYYLDQNGSLISGAPDQSTF